ncbi:unnamed protein product [Diatraea saccharalis]|uniref:Uncharacterized protein n=1 Tax=Diatraea saccharalis TaxID=40085 RepID=A0A9N9QUC5_9NEOP|nr:unnamed protein product [Diatraea saccharalis]
MIYFSDTNGSTPDDDDVLVLEVPLGSTKVILGKKRYGDRSQLWRRGPGQQLVHEGSSPPQPTDALQDDENTLSPHAMVTRGGHIVRARVAVYIHICTARASAGAGHRGGGAAAGRGQRAGGAARGRAARLHAGVAPGGGARGARGAHAVRARQPVRAPRRARRPRARQPGRARAGNRTSLFFFAFKSWRSLRIVYGECGVQAGEEGGWDVRWLTLRPGSGRLAVRVHAQGPTRLLAVTDAHAQVAMLGGGPSGTLGAPGTRT